MTLAPALLMLSLLPDGRLWEVEHGPRGGDDHRPGVHDAEAPSCSHFYSCSDSAARAGAA